MCAVPGTTRGLTRNSCCENKGAVACPVKRLDVVMYGNLRPMFFKNLLAKWVDLDKLNGLKSCPSAGQGKSSDSRKQVDHLGFHFSNHR
jgi:hypothetical protein